MRETIFKANVGLEGLTPMLHHACNGLGEQVATDATTSYTEEWRKTLYQNSKGNLIVPERCLSACIRDAGKGMKIGKSSMPRLISSGVQIEEFEVEIRYPGKNGNVMTEKDIEEMNTSSHVRW